MIVVNLFYFSSIHRFLFTCVFHESIYNALREEKNRRTCTFFLFVLNVIVLVYNGWKQSIILQTKPNRLLQISFFHRNLMFI